MAEKIKRLDIMYIVSSLYNYLFVHVKIVCNSDPRVLGDLHSTLSLYCNKGFTESESMWAYYNNGI